MACCSFEETVDRQFSAKKVEQELDRYRRHGVGPTAHMLVEGLSAAGLTRGTLLDVGGGVGGLTFALLDRGVDGAVIVEASHAYAAAASAETARRGRATSVTVTRGDFLDVADQVRPAAIVALDRVVCCYPGYAELLNESLGHAERVFAYSYPRDRWYVRAGVALENAFRRSGFRSFVHSEARMRVLIQNAGFELVDHRHSLMWSADVFARRPPPIE